jgi:hypothetical protein
MVEDVGASEISNVQCEHNPMTISIMQDFPAQKRTCLSVGETFPVAGF